MRNTNMVRVDSRRRNQRKKWILRIILLALLVGIGFGVYTVGKQLWAHDGISTTSKQGQHVVTSVAAFDTVTKEKQSPTMYNGMKRKVAYLTFDDGPNSHTPEILRILKEHNIKATFFMLGNSMQQHPDLIKQIVDEGHYPALHSMTHNFTKLYRSGSANNFIEEQKEAQQLVKEATGVTTNLIRAPYGSAPQIKEPFRDDIAEAGFKMWDWTLDTLDWNYAKNPSGMLDEVKRGLKKDTEVILMHDRKQTVEILPELIEYISSQGYEFEVYDPNAHFVVNFHHDERL
ncbi:polysaccharide deacetylase family protein [Paenibacillus assamensis]|uniref:polysaccharide deacetylase family protein n=1 Tax=Paenibacillus assamensis TaxID=311244 RepID=UPI00247FDF1D|nr:polysaccharide deacetylase family protein [Paenibacillus assamensis]